MTFRSCCITAVHKRHSDLLQQQAALAMELWLWLEFEVANRPGFARDWTGLRKRTTTGRGASTSCPVTPNYTLYGL